MEGEKRGFEEENNAQAAELYAQGVLRHYNVSIMRATNATRGRLPLLKMQVVLPRQMHVVLGRQNNFQATRIHHHVFFVKHDIPDGQRSKGSSKDQKQSLQDKALQPRVTHVSGQVQWVWGDDSRKPRA